MKKAGTSLLNQELRGLSGQRGEVKGRGSVGEKKKSGFLVQPPKNQKSVSTESVSSASNLQESGREFKFPGGKKIASKLHC